MVICVKLLRPLCRRISKLAVKKVEWIAMRSGEEWDQLRPEEEES